MLKENLFKLLADVYVFSIRLQHYHWNVEGHDFKQYHDLFGSMYDDVSDSIDTIAELIRTLDENVPISLAFLKEKTSIDEVEVKDAMDMLIAALAENSLVTISLLDAYKSAESDGEVGISNYLQDRIQMHEKHKWFLRSISKKEMSDVQ